MDESGPGELARAIAGDAVALRSLFERFGPQVAAEIRSQIGRTWQAAIDADDVMQITYIEGFLQIGGLTARDPAAFLSWLRRIAQNNLRDAIKELERAKRPNPRKRLADADGEGSFVALVEMLGVDSLTPSRAARTGEARRAVSAALEKLPPDYAAVVRLYDLEGREIADVARELRRSPGAVHMLRARAHDRLRALLGEASGFFSTP
jgi:RNA polymerase sigma factor (sigma-70 family)